MITEHRIIEIFFQLHEFYKHFYLQEICERRRDLFPNVVCILQQIYRNFLQVSFDNTNQSNFSERAVHVLKNNYICITYAKTITMRLFLHINCNMIKNGRYRDFTGLGDCKND